MFLLSVLRILSLLRSLAAITKGTLGRQTYMVAIAMSLSERLSLVDFGAAGNSISNLGSFDMVPACFGESLGKFTHSFYVLVDLH